MIRVRGLESRSPRAAGVCGFSSVTAAGIGLGLLVAVSAAPLLTDLLFVVSLRDGFAFGTGVTVLFASAALACWLPARRAARIDPMEALRHE